MKTPRKGEALERGSARKGVFFSPERIVLKKNDKIVLMITKQLREGKPEEVAKAYSRKNTAASST